MSLGENIQAARVAAGLTQEQLATEAGVSRQTVAKWESDETSPDLTNAAKLADALEVSLDQLVSYDSGATGLPVMPKGKHIFGTVVMGERGQVVIPKAAREVFSIAPGDSLVILGEEERGLAICRADDFMAGINALVEAIGRQK